MSYNNTYVIDVDGDGAMDLLKYSWVLDNYLWVSFAENLSGTVRSIDLPTFPKYVDLPMYPYNAFGISPQYKIFDANGDGLQDIVRGICYGDSCDAGRSAGIWINTGGAYLGNDAFVGGNWGMDPRTDWPWIYPHWGLGDPLTGIRNTRVLDYDGDGILDLLAVQTEVNGDNFENRSLTVALLRGTGDLYDNYTNQLNKSAFIRMDLFFTFESDSDQPLYHLATDLDGDTLPDLVAAAGDQMMLQSTGNSFVDVIVKIRDGRVGVGEKSQNHPLWDDTWTHKIEYISTSDPSVYSDGDLVSPIPAEPCAYPIKCKRPTKHVVHRHSRDMGDDAQPMVVEYFYRDGRYDLKGRGWLGFGEITKTNMSSATVTTVRYDNGYTYDPSFHAYPNNGRILQSRKKAIVNAVSGRYRLTTTDNTYLPNDLTNISNGKTYSTVLRQSHTRNYESTLSVPAPTDLLSETLVTNELVNEYGDIERTVVSDGAGTTSVTDSQYIYDTNLWLLSLLKHRVVANTSPVESKWRTEELTYHPDTRIVKTHTVEPGTNMELVSEYSIDDFGNVWFYAASDTTSGSVRTAEIIYDAEGIFPEELRNSLGHTIKRAYDRSLGNILVEQHPNLLTTFYGYDGFGRRLRVVKTDQSEAYLRLGEVVHSNSRSVQTIERYEFGALVAKKLLDRQGREIKSSRWLLGGQESYQTFRYGNLGKQTSVTIPAFAGNISAGQVDYTYDFLGRLRHIQKPDGTGIEHNYEGHTTWTYKTTGQWPLVTRHLGRSKTRNKLGQIVLAIDEMQEKTQYFYGAFGKLRRVLDPDLNETTIITDAYGRVTEQNTPSSGLDTRTYNTFGELRTTRNANGEKVTYTYDVLGRVETRTDKDNVATWTYDNPVNGIGKLWTSETNNWGHTTEYSYNADGKLSNVLRTVDGDRYDVALHYDSFGRLWKTDYPEDFSREQRFSTEYLYDAYGHNTEVRNSVTQEVYWQATAVDASSRLIESQQDNGAISTQRTFNTLNGQIKFITAMVAGGSTLQDLEYDYDDYGRLEKRYDHRVSASEEFGYDNLSRLTSATYCWLEAGMETCNPDRTYRYHANGNIRNKSDVGVNDYVYDPAQPYAVVQAGTQTFHYDSVGNQTRRNGVKLKYTSAGKLLNISKWGKVVDVEYNAEHNRVLKQGPSSKVVYIGSLYERVIPWGVKYKDHKFYVKANGTTVAVVTRRVEREEVQASTDYLHRDNLGSVVAITSDGGSDVKQRLSFDPFGQNRAANWSGQPTPVDVVGIRYGFTGHEHDEDMYSQGLINMGGREYDANIGRFLTPDPIVMSRFSSQNLNRYSYVLNNPTNLTDPTGYAFDIPGLETPEIEAMEQELGYYIDMLLSSLASLLKSNKKKKQMSRGVRSSAADDGNSASPEWETTSETAPGWDNPYGDDESNVARVTHNSSGVLGAASGSTIRYLDAKLSDAYSRIAYPVGNVLSALNEQTQRRRPGSRFYLQRPRQIHRHQYCLESLKWSELSE